MQWRGQLVRVEAACGHVHRAAIPDMAGHIDAWRSGHGDEYGSDECMIAERLADDPR
jgi:hypothetical protein